MNENDITPKEKFLKDFFIYGDWFEREREIPDGSWAWEFVKWLAGKITAEIDKN